MSVGIDKLVDAFMGNPAPLEAKVEKNQQGQKPGELPEDFEEALALQQINELRQGAQNQQAMQAGGAQPSIVEKLKQMLAAQQRGQSQPMPGQPPQFQPPQGQPQMAQGQPPMPQGPQGGPLPAPQGQPVMAARGGSIDQLMSNLGRHYAGGGIVAFAPGGEIKLGTDFASFLQKMGTDYVEYANSSPEFKNNIKEMYRDFKAAGPAAEAAPSVGKVAPAAAEAAKDASLLRRASEGTGKLAGKLVKRAGPVGLGLEALSRMGDYKINAPDNIDTSAAGTLSDLAKGEFGRVGTGLKRGLGETAMDAGSFLANLADYVVPGKAPVSSAYDKFLKENVENLQGPERAGSASTGSGGGRPTMANDPRLAKDFNPTPTGPGAGRAPGTAIKNQITGTSPDDVRKRPSAGEPSASVPAAPAAAMDPNSLRAVIEANIRKNLGKDEDAEWAKGAKRYEDFMGIDKLLQPREARIAERQEMIKRIQGERTPDWVEALSAAGTPIRGGVGSLINMMGNKAQATRAGYSAEDLKFFDEIGAMQDEVAKLKLDGKYKAAAAGEAAIKDAIANKRESEQSGTSLLTTDENAAQRRQAAQLAADTKLEAAKLRTAGSGQLTPAQRGAIIDKAVDNVTAQLKQDIRLSMQVAKNPGLREQMIQRETDRLLQAAGGTTMAVAPGAAGPGGTSKPGWGIKPLG